MGEEIVIGLRNYRKSPFKPHSNLKGNRIHLGTTKYCGVLFSLHSQFICQRVTSLYERTYFIP